MARFNLEDYETVEERIRRFYEDNPDGRIITEWANAGEYVYNAERETGKRTWVVKATVYLTGSEQGYNRPKATGLAFEIDGGSGANQTAALENAETSAIGRALANASYSGNKRASRTEMAKVAKAEPVDYLAKLEGLNDIQSIRLTYAQAKAAGADAKVLDKIKARGESLNTRSKDKGDGARLPDSSKPGKSS